MLIKVDKQCKALGVGQRTQRDDLKKPILPLYLCLQTGNIVLSETEQAFGNTVRECQLGGQLPELRAYQVEE